MRSAVGIVENEFHLRQVPIDIESAGEAVKTLVDKNQVEQVFINLLLNALHAVEDHHGLVAVKTIIDRPNEKILVRITDNGCGIPPENMKKIFDPFFSTKSNGTGLGLAVSYGIVRNHNGDIRVSSKPGSGTCFTVEFPIVSAEESAGVSP
jgi:signal transduction histidine kinase